MTIPTATINSIKLARRISTDAFDSELVELAQAALADLGLAGVNGNNAVVTDPLVLTAIKTYVAMNFGQPDDYNELKASYDEQKAQLASATGYTKWTKEA